MNNERPACQQCDSIFSETRIPLLLPECGHSVCGECIQESLDRGELVICREDGVVCVNRTHQSDFPKNFALLKMFQGQRRLHRNSISRSAMMVTPQYDVQSEQTSSNSDKGYKSNTTNATANPQQNNIDFFTKNQASASSKNVSMEDFSDNLSNEHNNNNHNNRDLCSVHRKENEIYCMNCHIKICTNCALFAEHRLHEVLPFEEAQANSRSRAENLEIMKREVDDYYQRMREGWNFHKSLREHLENTSQDVMIQIDRYFKDFHELLEQKKYKLKEEVRHKIIQMEMGCKQVMSEMGVDVRNKTDLWLISTREKLNLLRERREKAENYIDLFHRREDDPADLLMMGNHILQEMDTVEQHASEKFQDIAARKLCIEYKGGFEKALDLLFRIYFSSTDAPMMLNSRTNTLKESQLSFLHPTTESGTDIFLLKDINNSSFFQDINTNYQEMLNQQEEQILNTPKRVSFLNVPDQRRGQQGQAQGNGRKSSVSPLRRQAQQKGGKLSKLGEKYQPVLAALLQDTLETADFTGAAMGDDLLSLVIPAVVGSQKLKVLKLAKNKLSDNGVSQLIQAVLAEQNKDQYSLPSNNLASINLSNNVLTDKCVDLMLEQCLRYQESMHVQSLRSLQLSLNLINGQRVKKKMEELKKLGVNLQL